MEQNIIENYNLHKGIIANLSIDALPAYPVTEFGLLGSSSYY
jgi:hypothetical protein